MTRTAPRPAPKTNTTAIANAMRLILEPGQVTEVRALEAIGPGDRRLQTWSGYFDDPDALAKAATSIIEAKGIYFVPNPVNPALLSRAANRLRPAGKHPLTADADISRRHWLMVDLDAARPADISASDVEHDAALLRAEQIRDHLAADGWPDPIFADSGNGAHLLYRIDLPADDGGQVQRCLESLDAQFSGSGVDVDLTVFNPARIWKLYGTLACKGDSTADRPHRMSRIVEAPDEIVTVPPDLLEALAAKAPKPAAPEWQPSGNGDRYKQFSIDGWIAQHALDVEPAQTWQGSGRKWMFRACPFDQNHTDRSAIIGQRPDGKLLFNCSHNSCTGNDWHALRELVEPGHRDRRDTYQGNGQAGANGHQGAGQAEPIEFERLTSRQLAEMDHNTPCIVDGILPERQGGIIGGRYKTLKTAISIDLGFAVATGTPFLGRFNVPQALPVGIMSAEIGHRSLYERGQAIAASRGFDLRDVGNLIWSTASPKIGQQGQIEMLERFITNDALGLLILDPSYLAFAGVGDSASNVFKMGGFLIEITRLIERTGCAISLVNHTTKGRAKDIGRYDPPELGELAMSGFAEWARFWLLLGPRQEWDNQAGQHWLWLQTGGSGVDSDTWSLDVREGRRSDPGGRIWDVSVATAGDARREREQQAESRKAEQQERTEADHQRKLAAALLTFPAGETSRVLREAAGLNSKDFATAIRGLLNSGKAEKIDINKRGVRYDGYRPKG